MKKNTSQVDGSYTREGEERKREMNIDIQKEWLASGFRTIRLIRKVGATCRQVERGQLTAKEGQGVRRKLSKQIAVERLLRQCLRHIRSIDPGWKAVIRNSAPHEDFPRRHARLWKTIGEAKPCARETTRRQVKNFPALS